MTILRKSDTDGTWRRQLELTRQLDATALIEIVLAQPHPGTFWRVIMDALVEAKDVSTDRWIQLKSLAWLPGTNGEYIRPEDVIDLPLLSDEVACLTSSYPGVFWDPELIASNVREHKSFDVVRRKMFPSLETALSMLGELLIEDPANHIGNIRRDRFKEWQEIAHDVPQKLLPCGPLIHHAADAYPDAAIRIFDQLTKPEIPLDRARNFLDYLRQAHQRDLSSRRKSDFIAVFNEYVRLAVNIDGYENTLVNEQLPTRYGEWKSATALCCGNDGIAASSVVDSDTEEVLSPFMPSALIDAGIGRAVHGFADEGDLDWAAVMPKVKVAAERLQAYFAPWQDIVPNEQIGGFLSLLGDDPGISDLAQQYLGTNRTLEETRLKFGLPQMKAGELMEDGLTMMAKQRVVVEAIQDETVRNAVQISSRSLSGAL